MGDASFRIICNHLETEEIFDVEVCFFGMDFSNLEKNLTFIESLKGQGFLIKVSILDAFHYFSDESSFKKLVSKYRDLCLISPEKTHFVESFNTFLNYSQAKYIFFFNAAYVFEKFEWKNMEGYFEENKRLAGLVPCLKSKNETLDSLYGLSDFKTLDIYRKDFKGKVRTFLPHQWTWLVHRERCLLFGSLDSHYRYFFSSSFDFTYHLLRHGYVIEASEDFSLTHGAEVFLESIETESFHQDRFFFSLKNLKNVHFAFHWSRMGFFPFITFFFLKIFLFARFYLSRKEKMNDISLYADEEIIEALDQ